MLKDKKYPDDSREAQNEDGAERGVPDIASEYRGDKKERKEKKARKMESSR